MCCGPPLVSCVGLWVCGRWGHLWPCLGSNIKEEDLQLDYILGGIESSPQISTFVLGVNNVQRVTAPPSPLLVV